jgi:uncharacterized lipoprotein YmbA
MNHRLARRALLVLALAPPTAGCTTSPPSRLHVLAVEPEAPLPSAERRPPVLLGVGPVEVVDYLERPELVLRRGRTSLELAELDRWAERFEVMFGRVLRESLARLLATDDVIELPSDREVQPDWRIAVQLLRFEAQDGREVELEARWSLFGGTGDRPLRLERTVLREPVEPGPGMEPVVAATSRALGAFARKLAEAVLAEERARPARRPATARSTGR